MLGAYSQDALSGVALVNQIQFIFANAHHGRRGKALWYWAHSFGANATPSPLSASPTAACALALSSACCYGRRSFSSLISASPLFTNEERVIAEGMQYLRIICFSYPLFAFTNILLCSLRSVETVRIGFFVSLSTLMINVGLNYVPILSATSARRVWLRRRRGLLRLRPGQWRPSLSPPICLLADKKLRLRPRDFLRLDHSLFKRYLKGCRLSSPTACGHWYRGADRHTSGIWATTPSRPTA